MKNCIKDSLLWSLISGIGTFIVISFRHDVIEGLIFGIITYMISFIIMLYDSINGRISYYTYMYKNKICSKSEIRKYLINEGFSTKIINKAIKGI